MKQIFCISGLGADHLLFQHLSIPGYELVPLTWKPHSKNDNMCSYAAKMVKGITAKNATVIGLSFGGMLAVEIGKQHPTWKIFLVSSAKTSAELGYDNAFIRWIGEKELIPASVITKPNVISLALLGAKTKEDKKLITEIMDDADPAFYKWCVHALLSWDNHTYPPGIIHIHGTYDRVIRPANVHPRYWIGGGSHIMIYNRAREVSKIISECLSM